MQKKKGPGKSYIYIPKKKADAVTQMKIEQDSELTFAPELNIPASILEGRVIANGVLSEYLYGQAEILKKKGDSYRENIKQQELKSCTFKPFLHKAPKGVQPAYRGLNGIVESHNELHDTRKKPQAVIHINGRTSSPLKSNLLNQSSVCGTPDSIQRKLDNILSGNDVNKGFLGDKPKSTDDVLVRTDRGISIESSSSLAGVRALGEYDENFIRLESCDEETIAKEKCQSQESFAVLKNTISNELGPEDETDKFSSALREGGSEIDSKTIPFETYYEKTGLASTRKSI
jgi:hypothetical protein